MPFDSVADLLFNIGANTDDAEENVARFRALLGTNLDGMGDQFEDWSDRVFGNLDTVKGAMLGVTGAIAAAAVAAAALGEEAGHHFEEFAIEVDNAAKKTGISVEQMSALKFTADELGIPFDRLVIGINRFQSSIFKANEGARAQDDVFKRLGITQQQLQAGEKDALPLLELVSDRMRNLSSGTERAAVARELFSRGGAELIRFLNLGSEGMKELAKEAAELGRVLGDKDVAAAREYEAAVKRMHAATEALDREIGEHTLPLMMRWKAIEIGLIEAAKGGGSPLSLGFWVQVAAEAGIASAQIEHAVALAEKAADKKDASPLLPPPAKTKEAAEDIHTLTDRLEEMHVKLSELDGPEEKLNEELTRMAAKAREAFVELVKQNEAHKLAPGVYEREAAAFAELIALMERYNAVKTKGFQDEDIAALQKYIDSLAEAKKHLQEMLSTQTADGSYGQQQARWAKEIEDLRTKYAEEGKLDADAEAMLEALKKAGAARIANEQQQAYTREMEAAQAHLEKMLEGDMTAEQKLAAQYQLDVNKFSEAEAQKVAKTAASQAEREAIEKQYAANRLAVLNEYKNKLQELENSQGFQGVFGDHFAQLIKKNESLSKEWSQSTDQSMLMVQVALESMKEMAGQAFDKFAEGMGDAIAHAMVYDKSIGQAMRSATAATLESIAAQSMTQAIYSLALGFLDLAEGDFAGAGAAFEAAALFGAVGVGAAMAGRAVNGHQGAGGGGGGSRSGGGGGSGPGGGVGGTGGGSGIGGPGAGAQVAVYVQGHVIGQSGVEELAGMINDAVQNRDVRLVASQVRQAPLATH